MRYEDFRELWASALQQARLRRFGSPEESLDLVTLEREYSARVEPLKQDTPPFLVTAEVKWSWAALLTARSATSDGDAVREVLGTDKTPVSAQPWTRVDVELSATLLMGEPAPMPSAKAWAEWSREVLGRLERIEPLLPEERARLRTNGLVEPLAWREEPNVDVICQPGGVLALAGVRLRAGFAMDLPRQGEDEEGDDVEWTRTQVDELLSRLTKSLDAWAEALDHLRPNSKP